MNFLVAFLWLMLLVRFIVVLVNFLSRLQVKDEVAGKAVKLSVLIPARNEEHTIGLLLHDLQQTGYPNLEIIVCDDASEDKTAEIIRAKMETMSSLSYFTNLSLPEGWGGKNFACHELAQRASGDYYLFLDADVRLEKEALHKALAYALRKKTALLSVFPQQIIQSQGEWRTVPWMNRILLSFLPLALVRWYYFPSLSAANGQFMLFESANYRRNEWHKKVKNQAVEDILIARMMKKQREQVAVLLGNDAIRCRMYSTENEAIKGFGRNIHQYFGGSRLWLSFFVLLSWTRLPFLFLAGFFQAAFIATGLVLLMSIMISRMSGQSPGNNLKLLVSQQIALTRIWIQNLRQQAAKKISWKGRQLDLE